MAIETFNYNGKEELTMAQFESLLTLEDNTDYDITDYPDTSITNDQMKFALTCQRLFPIGTTFICSDNGDYKQNHTYMIKGTPKQWVDITVDKLAQSYEQSDTDNAVIIRNGNIVTQMVTFNVTGNSEKIWSFPYSYDVGKNPICWCNSIAEGQSVSNGAAVISWTNTSMTVRNCGVDSNITFYAQGWITN